jgi:hypothetical protein
MNRILVNQMTINKNYKVLIRDKEVIAMKEIKLSKPKVPYKEEKMKKNDGDRILSMRVESI